MFFRRPDAFLVDDQGLLNSDDSVVNYFINFVSFLTDVSYHSPVIAAVVACRTVDSHRFFDDLRLHDD